MAETTSGAAGDGHDDGALLPVLAVPEHASPPPPVPALPAAEPSQDELVLRSEGIDGGGGEGSAGARSMMLVAVGIAVAALRGMSQWLADRRQRFEDQAPVRLAAVKAAAEGIAARAEHAAALHKISSDAAQARAKARVQSPTEFGASAKKNSGKGAGNGSGSGGGGGPSAGKKGPLPGPPPKKPAAAADRSADPKRARQEAAEQLRAARRETRARDRDRAQAVKAAQADARKKQREAQDEAKRRKRSPGTTLEKARDRLAKRRPDPTSPDKTPQKKENKDTKKENKGPRTPGSGLEPVTKPKPKPTAKPEAKAKPKSTPKPEAKGKSRWGRQSPKSQPKPRWRKKPKAGPAAGTSGSRPGSRSRRTREQTPPRQTPGEDGSWLRPPPGMEATYSTTITRDPMPPKNPPRRPAALTRGRGQLPPGSPPTPTPTPTPTVPSTPSGPPAPPAGPGGAGGSGGPPAPAPVPGPRRKEATPLSGAVQHTVPVTSTQFTDSDLTVYDVIEADEDQAQEILAGAEHALLVAERCDRLAGAIEALKAELESKFVPGVLVGWCTRLIERAKVVEEKALAVAAGLPRASEAIAQAGQLAAEHDRPVADLVRDMGHTAPAAASYHKE
ncbi:hypothetical protein [Streptomyces sp. NPDC051567]|uniref:hypothetical protein n=1 Tax=Streptomyces sp. NPDC051567 TaxID=3365660 RepID=UPI0037B621D4